MAVFSPCWHEAMTLGTNVSKLMSAATVSTMLPRCTRQSCEILWAVGNYLDVR